MKIHLIASLMALAISIECNAKTCNIENTPFKEYVQDNRYFNNVISFLAKTNQCTWLKKADAILINANYKDIGFVEFDKRCALSKQLATQFEKQAKGAVVNQSDFLISEKNSIVADAPLTFTEIKGDSLAGDCGKLTLKLLKFNSTAQSLNQYVEKYTPHTVLLFKHNKLTNLGLLEAEFKKTNYEYLYEEELDYLKKDTISFTHTLYHYNGGAHGGSKIKKVSFNLKTGHQIKLEDLVDIAKMPELLKVAEKNFIKSENASPDKSWEERGYWFERGFYLPDNFNVTGKGLTFIYQSYEIAPYSYGAPTVELSWNDLKPFLK